MFLRTQEKDGLEQGLYKIEGRDTLRILVPLYLSTAKGPLNLGPLCVESNTLETPGAGEAQLDQLDLTEGRVVRVSKR